MQLTPRDWQQIALREASELLGTPEGAAKLVEANRYGALADKIERLTKERDEATHAERRRCAQVCEDIADGFLKDAENTQELKDKVIYFSSAAMKCCVAVTRGDKT